MTPASTSKDDYAEVLALYDAGSLADTWVRVRELLDRDPAHVPALLLAGVVAAHGLESDAALSYFDRALVLQPDNPRAQFNKAGLLLQQGDWERGLPLYEARWRLPEFRQPLQGASPPRAWRGEEDISGKRMLLRCEQGLGDTLQFCRFAPLLAARGAYVVLEVQRSLLSLLADLPDISRIVIQGGPLPVCDFECPLMSLPLALGSKPDAIPYADGYLASDATKVFDWRARLGPAVGRRVGLAWRGTATRSHDRRRSIPLGKLIELLPRHHQYFSLQKDPTAEEQQLLRQNPWIIDHTAELYDFSDTAALCECLDLVISIDTSVAHLSGGLGKPTWILLHYAAAWRWLLDRSDSPWYRSAVLFRQRERDDWSEPCTQVAERLRQPLAELPK